MIVVDSKIPVITGAFLAIAVDYPRLTSISDINPDDRAPKNAAINGIEARKPDCKNPSLYTLLNKSGTMSRRK